jgi:D-alanyl-D-alanine dipeptidase
MNETIYDAGFVFLDDNIKQDLMYVGTHNFTGAVVPGYIAKRAIFTKQAAEALLGVENQLCKQGYAILVKDTYSQGVLSNDQVVSAFSANTPTAVNSLIVASAASDSRTRPNSRSRAPSRTRAAP